MNREMKIKSFAQLSFISNTEPELISVTDEMLSKKAEKRERPTVSVRDTSNDRIIDENVHSLAQIQSGEVLLYKIFSNEQLEHLQGIIETVNRDEIGILSVVLSNGQTIMTRNFAGTMSKEFVNEKRRL